MQFDRIAIHSAFGWLAGFLSADADGNSLCKFVVLMHCVRLLSRAHEIQAGLDFAEIRSIYAFADMLVLCVSVVLYFSGCFFFLILFFVAVATLMKGTPNYSRFCDILVQFLERNWLDVALMPIAVSDCVRQTSGECKRFLFLHSFASRVSPFVLFVEHSVFVASTPTSDLPRHISGLQSGQEALRETVDNRHLIYDSPCHCSFVVVRSLFSNPLLNRLAANLNEAKCILLLDFASK